MNIKSKIKFLITFMLLINFSSFAEKIDALAPDIREFDAKDFSYEFAQTIPDLKDAFIDLAPAIRNDGIPVGQLGLDGGHKKQIIKMAEEIANHKEDLYDSMLISYQGKLIFESYYSRGRINLPHFQKSATKAYTALLVGRAIQLGYLTMADLNKPVSSFLKELKPQKFVEGVENITLHKAMTMSSGLNLNWAEIKKLRKFPEQLKGQALVQAYFEHSAPISLKNQTFSYKSVDATLIMQVIEAVVPGTAKAFIKKELLDKMDIKVYRWGTDVSGLPTAPYGSSMTSRDMVKWGTLTINKGKWQGKQLISAAFIKKMLSNVVESDVANNTYGYFWWRTAMKVGDKIYVSKSARGGGGQYILLIEELDLVVVVTANNKLGSDDQTLALIENSLLPAFVN